MSTTSQSYAPRLVLDQHIAAVKAVAWCPWQRNVLATGGGTADRTIRIWNTHDGANLQCVDTGSQVCSIQWSNYYKELVSSHGFSDNQLIVWKYKDMSKVSLDYIIYLKNLLYNIFIIFILATRAQRSRCKSIEFDKIS